MKIKLTDCKSCNVISKIKKVLYEGKQTIPDLACVIGSLVATFPVLSYGKLYYREIDAKSLHLNFKKANIMLPACP